MVPSKGGEYLRYLLPALGRQTILPKEVVLVLKDCDASKVERLCNQCGLPSVIIEQRESHVTRAYEMGRKAASGDIAIFTDDDAIPPERWVENHLRLHGRYSSAACISSRDIILGSAEMRLKIGASMILPCKVRLPRALKVNRWIRLIRSPPHPIMRRYQLGLYLSKELRMVWGPYLPEKACLSTPYKGVNMSFKREALDLMRLPEHPLVRRGFGFEQHIALQLILRGFDCVYSLDNPVLHLHRESLSRTSDPRVWAEIQREYEVMRSMYADLIRDLS